MSRKKTKKMTKFDTIALDLAEGIARVPVEGKEAFTELLKEVDSKEAAPSKKKLLSAKIRKALSKKPKSKDKRKKS
jgi:hypothetical protein